MSISWPISTAATAKGNAVGLFSRKAPASIPQAYARMLEQFGEHLAGQPTNFTTFHVDLDMLNFMQRDPEGYVQRLAALIDTMPEPGAFCLGATDSTAVAGAITVSTPDWDRLVDGAIAYIRGLNVSYGQAKPYMKSRWAVNHTPQEW